MRMFIHPFLLLTLAGIALKPEIIHGQQRSYFTKNWLFKPGDSITWAEYGYSHQHWDTIDAGKSWQAEGYEHTGYGWYRYSLVIPRSARPAIRNRGFMKIHFGQVNECAQYFMNGRGLGQSGSLPPKYEKADPSKTIEFYISEDEILWDTINSICIRVYSRDSIQGGMVKGPVYWYVPKSLSEP